MAVAASMRNGDSRGGIEAVIARAQKQSFDAELASARPPVDWHAWVRSAARVEEAVHGGWGSNVIAAVIEQAFDHLDAPPMRLGLPDSPLPYSPPIEDDAIPSPDRIAARARELVAYAL